MSRLKDQYQNEIVDALTKKFGYKNIMEVPKLERLLSTWVLVKQKKMQKS